LFGTDHVTRLEQVFSSINEPVQCKESKAMKGLLEEGKDLMEEMSVSPALDAALIAAAQKVEHYGIASYGTLCAWAENMGQTGRPNIRPLPWTRKKTPTKC
jgi:ferritin-like metal-binding protein YciE